MKIQDIITDLENEIDAEEEISEEELNIKYKTVINDFIKSLADVGLAKLGKVKTDIKGVEIPYKKSINNVKEDE